MKHARRPTSRAANTRQGMQRQPALTQSRLNELLGAQPIATARDEELASRRAEFAAENKRLAEAARQRMQQERQQGESMDQRSVL